MRRIARRLPSGVTGPRRSRIAIALAAAGAICLSSLTAASADENTPSRDDIRSAKANVAATAKDVGEIKAQLASAEQHVTDLQTQAGAMAEAYNGAMYKLQQARSAERKAARQVKQAKRQLNRTGDRVASSLAASAGQDSSLRSLTAMLDQGGPQELLEQSSGFDSLNDAMAADLHRYDARKRVFELLSERAERAVGNREDLAESARQAKEAADAAVAEAEQATAGLRSKRGELIQALADAEGVSQSLVRERQHDLAEEAHEEAIEEAEQQGPPDDVEAPPPPDDTDAPPEDDSSDAPPPEDNPPPEDDGSNAPPPENNSSNPPPDRGNTNPPPDRGDTNPPPDHTNPPPDHTNPPPDHTSPPGPRAGVAAAIAYARAQLGEPYIYGAYGPDSWDCSGLTMMAWGSAGVSLPHWSVAQYAATTPVSMSSLRRGDLVFWSYGSPSSIYHVAMYLGNGMIIQAPHPGASVEIVSMYEWTLPDLAGRP